MSNFPQKWLQQVPLSLTHSRTLLNLPAAAGFSDCRHEREPGCAIRKAVSDGILSPSRLDNYLRSMREVAFEQEKSAIGLARSERKRWKGIGKLAKEIRKGQE